MKRCTHKGCGSFAFNLHQDGIDQGGLCDVHYWQVKCEGQQAAMQQALDALEWADNAFLEVTPIQSAIQGAIDALKEQLK